MNRSRPRCPKLCPDPTDFIKKLAPLIQAPGRLLNVNNVALCYRKSDYSTMSSSWSLIIDLEMVGLPVFFSSIVFTFKVVALWSKRSFWSPGLMSQKETSLRTFSPTKKKSNLDLFLLATLLGLNEKSFREGKNSLYGSVKLNSAQRSLSISEWRLLGSLCILRQSMLVSIGSVA